jgi:polar amino acid transport system substrate-binding protein
MRRVLLSLSVWVLALGMAACATNTPTTTASKSAGTGSPNPCSSPPLKTAGTLTVGTSFPYYKPFKSGPKENPTGFEGDLAHAIATKMGLSTVVWSISPFDALYAPGPKKFDFAMDEISFTTARAQVVDFSDPYYTIQQGLLVRTGTPITNAHTIADLKAFKFGAEVGTTGLDFIKNTIMPTPKVSEYDTTVAAGQALSLGQIYAVVIDVPIAIPMTSQFKDTQVIGQFMTNESYNLAFEKGNPLVACVNQVLAGMNTDGSLKALTDQYFPGTTADIPVFS